MASNAYHFITEWHVESTLQEVAEILGDAPDLMCWWPSVYLNVQVLEPGDERGIGKVIDLYTKGWLPYTLRWQFSVTEANAPYGFTLEAWGDFVGRGIWKFEQQGDKVKIIYDWKIRADKPMLRYLIVYYETGIFNEPSLGNGKRCGKPKVGISATTRQNT